MDRGVAICEDCGAVQSVRVSSDGELFPISTGKGPECRCGSTILRLVSDDPDVMASQEEPERSDEE